MWKILDMDIHWLRPAVSSTGIKEDWALAEQTPGKIIASGMLAQLTDNKRILKNIRRIRNKKWKKPLYLEPLILM